MPLSHKHKIIFIHIPKNGGTSITQYLEMENTGHYHYSYYTQWPKIWEEYRKITVVRNPWDRFVSCYEYAKMEKSYYHAVEGESIYGKHPDYELLKNKSFGECVWMVRSLPHMLKHDGWKPQLPWICDDRGKIKINHIFQLENINNEESGLSRFLGIPEKIPTINPTTRKKDYKEYYNDDTRQIIREVYNIDTSNLGYEF